MITQSIGRRLVAISIITASLLSIAQTFVKAAISGAVAEFRFDGDARNYANSQAPISAESIRFATDRFGVTNHALATPESGFVGSPSRDYLKGRRQWTWSAWIRSDFPAISGQVVYSEDAKGNLADIQINGGRVMVDTWNVDVPNRWTSVNTVGTIVAGRWYHIAVVFDAQISDVGHAGFM